MGLTLYWFVGTMFEGSPANLRASGPLCSICGALTAVIAATLNLMFCAVLGLSAIFSDDTSAAYSAWQKLSFICFGAF